MKCLLHTFEGLLVGWADLEKRDPKSGWVSGPFYPNDFYSLIRPTMRRCKWRHDATIGEFDEEEFMQFSQIMDEIGDLKLSLTNAETGKKVELFVQTIEEGSGSATLYALTWTSR